MAIGTIVGALAGLGASAYGAKKQGDALEKTAEQNDPFLQARAAFQVNNVDQHTPFGSVDYRIDDMGTSDPADDQYSMNQTYSPQMQQMLDAMMGHAGRAPATFSSGAMPTGLQDKMADVYGSSVPMASYSDSVKGFGQERRPFDGQLLTGFNYKNFDAQGNKIGNERYEPWSGDPVAKAAPEGTFGTGLNFRPGATTNQEVLDSVFAQGGISEDEYRALHEYFGYTDLGRGRWIAQQGDTQTLLSSIPKLGELFPEVESAITNLFSNVYAAPSAQPAGEPSMAGYDQDALARLTSAMRAAA